MVVQEGFEEGKGLFAGSCSIVGRLLVSTAAAKVFSRAVGSLVLTRILSPFVEDLDSPVCHITLPHRGVRP